MEIRNIQKTGGASFIFTLPKDWIKKYGLKDKDKLNIYTQKSGHLIVHPYSIHRHKPIITIHIDGLTKEHIQRELIGYYISGVEEIIILGTKLTPLQRSWVRQLIQGLIGFDYLEGTSERIIVKNILNAKEFSIKNNVERILSILLSMYDDLIICYQTKDRELARDIIERDTEIDRLHTAILRQFNYFLQHIGQEEVLGLSLPDVHYYERVGIRLERLADHVVNLCEILIISGPRFSKDYNRILHKRIKDTYQKIVECKNIILDVDKKKAHIFLDQNSGQTKKLVLPDNWLKKSSLEDLIEVSRMRVINYLINIAEETINYSNTKNNNFVI